jgi:hypothetical protein
MQSPDSAPSDAERDPAFLVRSFLAAMESRDLETARAFLAPGMTMRFPGPVEFTALEDLVAWSKPRYRFVKKTYDGFDTVPGEPAIVYCHGTLAGEWPDGTPFAGIRFIDRFEISGGRIQRQDVWNDLAEVRAQA